MDEVLTVEEIEARYLDEWVLLADPEVRKGPKVIRGTVVFQPASTASSVSTSSVIGGW